MFVCVCAHLPCLSAKWWMSFARSAHWVVMTDNFASHVVWSIEITVVPYVDKCVVFLPLHRLLHSSVRDSDHTPQPCILVPPPPPHCMPLSCLHYFHFSILVDQYCCDLIVGVFCFPSRGNNKYLNVTEHLNVRPWRGGSCCVSVHFSFLLLHEMWSGLHCRRWLFWTALQMLLLKNVLHCEICVSVCVREWVRVQVFVFRAVGWICL